VQFVRGTAARLYVDAPEQLVRESELLKNLAPLARTFGNAVDQRRYAVRHLREKLVELFMMKLLQMFLQLYHALARLALGLEEAIEKLIARSDQFCQQLKAIDRYITDVWGKGDLDAIDEIFTADRVRHGPDFEGTHNGATGQKDIVTLYRTSVPDLAVSVEAQIGQGDLVVTRWRATGTNLGPTMGVSPTGQSGEVWGFWMHRFEGDKIAEEWAAFDSHALLQLMGMDPR
jgi:predicted ester cyclase